jgi:hypothetical protein
MEDAPLLSNNQELVRRTDHVPAPRSSDGAASRRYDVLVHFAAVLTVEAADRIDARERAYGSTVLAVFDHGRSLVDETVVGVREADA